MRAIFRRLRGLSRPTGQPPPGRWRWSGAAALFFGARTLGLSSLGMVLSVSAGVGRFRAPSCPGPRLLASSLSIAERRKSIGDLFLGRSSPLLGCLGVHSALPRTGAWTALASR